MAYALRGSAGTIATGTTTVTPSFGQATAAGNLLIAWVIDYSSASPTACSDGTWSQAVNRLWGGVVTIFYKQNCGASETAPTFTTNQSSMTIHAALAEFTGGATSSPFDQSGTAGVGVSPGVAAASSADAAAGELVISVSFDRLTKAGTVTSSDTYNNGATATNVANNDATSIDRHYRLSYGVTTGNASATQNSHADNSMNLTDLTLAMATFKLPGAGNTYTKAGYGKESA